MIYGIRKKIETTIGNTHRSTRCPKVPAAQKIILRIFAANSGGIEPVANEEQRPNRIETFTEPMN